MNTKKSLAAIGLWLAAGIANAGLVRFDLVADGPLTVSPGSTVSFTVVEDFDPYFYYNRVPRDPEPGPAFIGGQTWYLGREEWRQEGVQTLDFAAWSSDGQTRATTLPGPDATWTFAMSFPAPGQYTVQAGGGWRGHRGVYYWSATSYRSCFFFICGSWDDDVTEYSYNDPIAGGFPTRSLQVTVVPEPGQAALLLSGLGLVAAAVGGRRAADRRREPARAAA